MPKVTKKIRGSARYYDDDSMEFIPQQEGEPKMRNAVKVGKSTAYTTNGEKQQSFVMHISVPDNKLLVSFTILWSASQWSA